MSELSDKLDQAVRDFERESAKVKKAVAKELDRLAEDRRSFGKDTEEMKRKMEKVVEEIREGGLKP